jgi:predicted permease
MRVLAFSALLAMFTSVLFGAAPAIQALKADLARALKEGAPNIARGHHRFRSGLIISQIALGLTLIVAAELMIASFLHLVQRDPGFRADHLLTFQIGLPGTQYNATAQVAFYHRLIARLNAIPGVQAAAMGGPLPLEGNQISVSFDIQERPALAPDRPHCDLAIVTPGYFHTMGIPLREGRDFTERDGVNAPPVLMVNEAFARKFFPGENAIGKRIEPGATNGNEPTRMREIVGIVGNAKQVPLSSEPDPVYYFPQKQLSWDLGTIVLRTAVSPLQIESAARSALTSLDPQAPMYRVRTGEQRLARAVVGPRFQMVLMGSFAAVALLLTVVGLYGVLSYAVARRRHEIGVRIALGAKRSEVLVLVLRHAALLLGSGLLVGLAGAFSAGRLLEGMVYGVQPAAALVIAGACCAMVITGLVAAYLPAARAASVDPIQALRTE